MARLTDRIEQVERELDNRLADDAFGLLERRLTLRKHLEIWGRERYDEGHHDGLRDARDTQFEANHRAEAAGEDT